MFGSLSDCGSLLKSVCLALRISVVVLFRACLYNVQCLLLFVCLFGFVICLFAVSYSFANVVMYPC